MYVFSLIGGNERINSSTIAALTKSAFFEEENVVLLKLKGVNGALSERHGLSCKDYNIFTRSGLRVFTKLFFFKYDLRLYGLHVKPNIILFILYISRGCRDRHLVNVRCSYNNLKILDKYLLLLFSFFWDVIVFPSQLAGETYPNRFHSCGVTISNGIDMQNQMIEKIDQAAVGSLRVVFLGRLEPVKNLGLLFEIINEFRSLDGIEFHIYGEGSLANEVSTLSNELDYVFYHGFISDIPAVLNCSDILISTSKSEGFSKVLLEGALHGLYILTTEVGGANEIISNGVNGRILDTPHQFAKELCKAIKHPIDYVALNQYNKVILQQFSITNFAQKIKEKLDETEV
jgi:glycosyltransferase involved in cell wall biosynthesis